MLWRDRRDVYVLSSMHNRTVQTVMKRPKGGREKVPIPCPTAVYDYNQFMGVSRPISIILFSDASKNDQVVEKGVLAPHTHFYNQLLDYFSFQSSK